MSNFDKSTPISNLNLSDESPVVEKILQKFDNLQQIDNQLYLINQKRYLKTKKQK